MSYRVCIPTAGLGSRLGSLTQNINKSLVSVGNRPVISHILEQFPQADEFVIALGYKGEVVQEFLELAYPDLNFTFVWVDPFDGPGSGLGYSLLCCEPYLQSAFIFCSCDTITSTPVPAPDHNWMGYALVNDKSAYRCLRVKEGQVLDIAEKGKTGPDYEAYIGLAGIKDYEIFWEAMKQGGDIAIASGEANGMRALIKQGIKAYSFVWFDTGNLEALAAARKALRPERAPNILEKATEAIWFVDDTVIKFSIDQRFIRNRVKRVETLAGYCPSILNSTPHMYQYREVKGDVLSDVITLPLFDKLLAYSQEFWSRTQLSPDETIAFRQLCLSFYQKKTEERIQQFYKTFGKADGTETINGQSMPTMQQLLGEIDWERLQDGLPGRFHGDFHFENILYSSIEDRFTFLDWRQDFGGVIEVGDIYYDLAKLLHGLIISHEIIARDLFSVEWTENNIRYDFLRKNILVECERRLQEFLQLHGYDAYRVSILTALIFLNIAALHHFPYSLLLYSLGKSMLFTHLRKQESGDLKSVAN